MRNQCRTGEGIRPSPHAARFGQAGKVARSLRTARMTATVTATAAANHDQQRPATAHNTRTISANWGYARPEKQTVGDQLRGAATVAEPLNSARRTWTILEYRPSPRPVTDGPGRCAHSYGSEGWGFESLRPRRCFRRPSLILRGGAGRSVTWARSGRRLASCRSCPKFKVTCQPW